MKSGLGQLESAKFSVRGDPTHLHFVRVSILMVILQVTGWNSAPVKQGFFIALKIEIWHYMSWVSLGIPRRFLQVVTRKHGIPLEKDIFYRKPKKPREI